MIYSGWWRRRKLRALGVPTQRRPRPLPERTKTDVTSEVFSFSEALGSGLTTAEIDRMEEEAPPLPELAKLAGPREWWQDASENWIILAPDGSKQRRFTSGTRLELEGHEYLGGLMWRERSDSRLYRLRNQT